jgi:hypothetical protein
MLAALGLFVFGLKTAPFETEKRSTAYDHAAAKRIGRLPAMQYTGPGRDMITFEGVLAPELTGGPAQLDRLREMASTGRPWILTESSGAVRGYWVIEGIEQTRSKFLPDGTALKIEFTVTLSRYDEDDIRSAAGDLSISSNAGRNGGTG